MSVAAPLPQQQFSATCCNMADRASSSVIVGALDSQNIPIMLKGMYAVWICYGQKLPEVESHTNVHV